jgi:hypothetical protein
LRAGAEKERPKINFSTAPEDLEQLSKEDASEKNHKIYRESDR